MPITFNAVSRRNPQKPNAPPKYYAHIIVKGKRHSMILQNMQPLLLPCQKQIYWRCWRVRLQKQLKMLQMVELCMQANTLHYKRAAPALVLKQLKDLITNIEKKAKNNDQKFQIYAHDILILNNGILFKNEEKFSICVPYNMFDYIMTEDKNTFEDALHFFQHQIKNSTSLNFFGQRDRKKFFNKMLASIEN